MSVPKDAFEPADAFSLRMMGILVIVDGKLHEQQINRTMREHIAFETPQATVVVVRGIDKQVVGEVAAKVRSIRPPEPYKGKGIRYAGERVVRKAGKAAK